MVRARKSRTRFTHAGHLASESAAHQREQSDLQADIGFLERKENTAEDVVTTKAGLNERRGRPPEVPISTLATAMATSTLALSSAFSSAGSIVGGEVSVIDMPSEPSVQPTTAAQLLPASSTRV